MSAEVQRYTAVAVVLHWAIAAAIVIMIPLGLWMHEAAEHGAVGDGIFRAYQLHKSIGLTILVLSLIRLGWRLANPPPPLPEQMPAWERFVAKATHWLFYFLIIAIPFSGWIYVSAGWSVHENQPLLVTTHWFGLFTVPHLFGLPHASNEVRASVAGTTMVAHFWMAMSVIALATLHVAAALKHHFFDRDAVLAHMTPGVRAASETGAPMKDPVRLGILGTGLGLTAVALTAVIYTLGTLGPAPAATPPPTSAAVAPVTPAPTPAAGADTASPAVSAPIADQAPAPAAGPAVWRVDSAARSLGFGFSFSDPDSGNAHLDGRFNRWRADIRFDPNNLAASSAQVTIELASAVDGVALHERNLPTEQWFNVPAAPTATFHTTSFTHSTGNNYQAHGELTVRGRSRNLTLPFTLAITGNRAVMNGRTTIDRAAFGVGAGSDADDTISHNVDVVVHIEAVRA